MKEERSRWAVTCLTDSLHYLYRPISMANCIENTGAEPSSSPGALSSDSLAPHGPPIASYRGNVVLAKLQHTT